MTHALKHWIAGCAGLLLLAAGPVSAQTAEPLEVTFRPVRDGGNAVTAIRVELDMTDANLTKGDRLILSAPVVYAGVGGIADRIEDLQVRDAQGVIGLTVSEDEPAPGGFPYYRHWTADRAVSFPVEIAYRARVAPDGHRGGPPFDMRAIAGGAIGAGSGFLLLPENVDTPRSDVHWDLSDLAEGSLASSSYGDGDFQLDGPPARLRQSWFTMGPAGRFPETGDINGLSGTWLGDFPWDPEALMEESTRVYGYLHEQFAYLGEAPRFRVFMRAPEAPPHGGATALPNSFMLSSAPAGDAGHGSDMPTRILFHEMLHNFSGAIAGSMADTNWFSEGLTSYYTTQLRLRGGFMSVAEYQERINVVAWEYYTNPALDWSSAEIIRVGFGDNFIRHLPYRRGELLFAELDSRIRAASDGTRTVDDFVEDVLTFRAEGQTLDLDAWRALLLAELDQASVELFDAVVLDGTGILVPADDAFGPCFTREAATLEREGETYPGYRWVRRPGVPDTVCATR